MSEKLWFLDPEVDAVYVATIHPYHRQLAELFLSHGKHVLVEKPAFTNVKDWDDMSALARKNNLLLAEAMKPAVFPAYCELRRWIQARSVRIESVEAAFGNWHDCDSGLTIFNPELSGGATLDVGVYALWLYVDLCRMTQTPLPMPTATFSNDNPQSGVDENAEFIFNGAIKGKLCASITRDLSREAIIKGPDLEIVIHGKWWNPCRIDIHYRGEHQQIDLPASGGGFEYEIAHISSLLLNGELQSPLMRGDTTRQVIEIMETCLSRHGFAHLTG